MNNIYFINASNSGCSLKLDIDTEHLFFIKIINNFDMNKYFITKSNNKYCNIDFLIMENNNLKTLYIEYKKRNIRSKNYNSFLLSNKKLEAINNKYKNTLIIYDCNDGFIFGLYDKDMLNSPLENINNGLCYKINKKYFKYGCNEDLFKYIKDYLK